MLTIFEELYVYELIMDDSILKIFICAPKIFFKVWDWNHMRVSK